MKRTNKTAVVGVVEIVENPVKPLHYKGFSMNSPVRFTLPSCGENSFFHFPHILGKEAARLDPIFSPSCAQVGGSVSADSLLIGFRIWAKKNRVGARWDALLALALEAHHPGHGL